MSAEQWAEILRKIDQEGSPAERAAKRVEAAKAKSATLDLSNTETVKVRELRVGDLITKLGVTEFPYAFELATVKHSTRYNNTALTSVHGWFTTRRLSPDDTAARVRV